MTTHQTIRRENPRDQVHPFWYRLAWIVVRIYFTIGGMKVFGQEHLPQRGRFIVAPNHVSHLDPPLISHVCKRTPKIIAKAELFKNPVFGFLIAKFGAFPVQRGKADRAAIRRAIEILESDSGLIIFPEGTRSKDGELGPPEIGFAMIAHAAKAPVVPVYLKGTNEAFSPMHPKAGCPKTEVHFGRPILFEEEYSRKGDRETLEAINTRVMQEIASLRDRACA
jgi:1-acyl-sn-glycerol-3-phosphate acyltransferase